MYVLLYYGTGIGHDDLNFVLYIIKKMLWSKFEPIFHNNNFDDSGLAYELKF